jgi:hypothetical protein
MDRDVERRDRERDRERERSARSTPRWRGISATNDHHRRREQSQGRQQLSPRPLLPACRHQCQMPMADDMKRDDTTSLPVRTCTKCSDRTHNINMRACRQQQQRTCHLFRLALLLLMRCCRRFSSSACCLLDRSSLPTRRCCSRSMRCCSMRCNCACTYCCGCVCWCVSECVRVRLCRSVRVRVRMRVCACARVCRV